MPPPPGPKPAAADPATRFATDFAQCLGRPLEDGERIALAVSGGGDSLALMRLAAAAFPEQIAVLSVDHGLRAESAAECEMVARLSESHGVPTTILRLSGLSGRNIQAEARRARYQAMADWCQSQSVGLLLTAHHADDQAETLLMRLARGSGLAGVTGIRACRQLRPDLLLLRPLLGWRRSELRQIVADTGWHPAEDPSNENPRFDRSRVRALLSGLGAPDPLRLSQTAAHLAEAEDALRWAAERAFATRGNRSGSGLTIDPEGLPAELQRRLLAAGLAQLGADQVPGPVLARLLARLGKGGRGTVGPVFATSHKGLWQLSPAPARRQK